MGVKPGLTAQKAHMLNPLDHFFPPIVGTIVKQDLLRIRTFSVPASIFVKVSFILYLTTKAVTELQLSFQLRSM